MHLYSIDFKIYRHHNCDAALVIKICLVISPRYCPTNETPFGVCNKSQIEAFI